MIEPIDIDAALANPSAYFAQPADVLAHPGISSKFKLKLLQQWEQDAHQLTAAEGEGMGGGEESMLQRVREALRSLEATVEDAASRVQHAAARTRDGIGEFRGFMRAQPITGALLMFGAGYLVGRIAGGHR